MVVGANVVNVIGWKITQASIESSISDEEGFQKMEGTSSGAKDPSLSARL